MVPPLKVVSEHSYEKCNKDVLLDENSALSTLPTPHVPPPISPLQDEREEALAVSAAHLNPTLATINVNKIDSACSKTTANISERALFSAIVPKLTTLEQADRSLLISRESGTYHVRTTDVNGNSAEIPLPGSLLLEKNVLESTLISTKQLSKLGCVVIADEEHGGSIFKPYNGDPAVNIIETRTGYTFPASKWIVDDVHTPFVRKSTSQLPRNLEHLLEVDGEEKSDVETPSENREDTSKESRSSRSGRQTGQSEYVKGRSKKLAENEKKRAEKPKETAEVLPDKVPDKVSNQEFAGLGYNASLNGATPLDPISKFYYQHMSEWHAPYSLEFFHKIWVERYGALTNIDVDGKEIDVERAMIPPPIISADELPALKIQKVSDYFLMQHRAWGHIGFNDLAILLRILGDTTAYTKLLKTEKYVDGKRTTSWNQPCGDCLATSYDRRRLDGTDDFEVASRPKEITYMDVVGPIKPQTNRGQNYELVIVDKYTKYVRSYPMITDTAAEVVSNVRTHLRRNGGDLSFAYGKVRTDNAKIFSQTNEVWSKLLQELNWDHKCSPSYRQELNGEVEAKIKVRWRKIAPSLRYSRVPAMYWDRCANWIDEVRNVSPLTGKNSRYKDKSRPFTSPYEDFLGHKVDSRHVKPFGCSAYVPLHILEKDKLVSSKFKDKRVKCVYLGPSRDHSYGTSVFGYWKEGSPLTSLVQRVVHHQDVIWLEHEMYYRDKGYSTSENVQVWMFDQVVGADEESAISLAEKDQGIDEVLTYESVASLCTTLEDWSVDRAEMTDSVIHAILKLEGQMEVTDGTSKEVKTYDDIMALPEGELRNKWIEALRKEFQGFIDTKSFEEVKLSSLDRNTLISNLNTILDIKSDGRFKARSVVAWRKRIAKYLYGNNLPDAYSPASKLENFRSLLALESYLRKKEGSEVVTGEQIKRLAIDVKQAFLNGEFSEDCMKYYVRPPKGFYKMMFGEDRDDIIWLLLKPVYGLPISGRRWYLKFKELIEQFGATRFDREACMFYKVDNKGKFIAAMNIHVDDSYIVGRSAWVDEFVGKFKSVVEITNLGDADRHLGIQISIDKDGDVALSQTDLVETMLREYNITEDGDSEHRSYKKYLPAPAGTTLTKSEIPEPGIDLRPIVGSLLYNNRGTNPALSVYVNMLSSQVTCPTSQHLDMAMRVLKWELGFKNAGIRFKADIHRPPIEVWVDAELGGNPTEARKLRSRGGFMIFMWGQLVHWRCRKHAITSTSTFDSEIRTLHECIQKAEQMKQNLVQIGIVDQGEPIRVYCDNEGTVTSLNNPLGTEKTGHLEFDNSRFYDDPIEEFDLMSYLEWNPEQSHKKQEQLNLCRIMEMVEKKSLIVIHVAGDENLADMLTKCLPAAKFYYCLLRCMCLDVTKPVDHYDGICRCVDVPWNQAGKEVVEILEDIDLDVYSN